MHVYSAYGLRISSDIPVADLLPPAGDVPDDHLQLIFHGARKSEDAVLAWLAQLDRADDDRWMTCGRTAAGYLLRFDGQADIAVRNDGGEIRCLSASDALPEPELHHLMLDHAMPLALKLRGIEPLHATTVLTPRGACAFIGPSGVGKSTLAAAFLHAGNNVLADDCTCVCLREGLPYVVPAYPGVRIHPDIRETLTMGKARARTSGQRAFKERWTTSRAIDTFPRHPQPLIRIYRLSRTRAAGEGSRVEPLSRRDGLLELVASTFRFDFGDRSRLGAEFDGWTRIIKALPVFRLLLADDVENAGAVRAVAADVQEI